MSGRRWCPERMVSLALAFLPGGLVLILGWRFSSPIFWIIGVGAIALAAMFLARQFGVGGLLRVGAGVMILVMGIGWPLVAADRDADRATDNGQWVSGEASGPWVNVSGDRVYAHNRWGTVVLDRATGEKLWTFRESIESSRLTALWLQVSENGSVLFKYLDDTMVYIGPDGRELWRIDGDDFSDTRLLPYAMAEETVAMGQCFPRFPEEEGEPCRFFGVLPHGDVGWEREGYPLPWRDMQGSLVSFQNGMLFNDSLSPYLLLQEAPHVEADILVIDAASGEELERLPAADLVFPAGDLVLSSERDEESCTLRAIRPDETVWTVSEIPCIADPYISGTRLYASTPDGSSVMTVDLEDGTWRDVGMVLLTNQDVLEWREQHEPVAFPMEQSIAFIDGGEIRVVDAGGGEELWRMESPGGGPDDIWSISAGHDTITVTSRTEPGWNPFEQRDDGLRIVGYDGLTGEPIAEITTDVDSLRINYVAAPVISPAAFGEIYVMREGFSVQRFGLP